MTKTELAYVAGIIDGEGHIGINRVTRPTGRVTPAHMPRVVVKMVDEALLRWLLEHFGGSLRIDKRYHPSHRQAYSWTVAARQADTFLRRLLPYLRVKRRHAELIIEYYEVVNLGTGRATSDEEIALRDTYWRAIKELNYGTIVPKRDTPCSSPSASPAR